MRVAILGGFAPSLVPFRGPLLVELVRRGHRVTAMAAGGTRETRDSLSRLGVDFEEVSLDRAGMNPRSDLETIRTLTDRLGTLRPDVLLAYTLKPVIYGHLAARLAHVPRRYAMLTGLGYVFLGQDRLRRRLLRRAVSMACRLALTDADGLFLHNPDDRHDLETAGALPSRLAVHVVRGSGVDLGLWQVAPMPPAPLVFLFVGRLLREKGILDFVEMARRVHERHPEVRFRTLGWVDRNPASVGRAELERWTSAGVIEHLGEVADVRPYLAASHVLVLPSYREGTPRSVLEAMAMGRPVIVSDVAGCRETIVDREHGLLVPPRDPRALADAAAQMIANPQLVATMGARARARIEALYDATAIAGSMADAMGL